MAMLSRSTWDDIPFQATLDSEFVGRQISEIEGPALILDLAILQRNCEAMLSAVTKLGVVFRAHVKTHKVLYGLPVVPSKLKRLKQLANVLGPDVISLMVDHPDGLGHSQTNILQDWPGAVGIFVKIDAGYHRAGISIGSPIWTALLSNIKDCESQDSSKIYLKGLYSHMGSSYDGNCPEDALRYLHLELQSLSAAAADTSSFDFKIKRLTLSVGATPTAMGAQSLVSGHEAPGTTDIVRLIRTIQERHDIEIHAGVYPLLDLQQIATHSRISFPSGGNSITTADIGIRVLVEVASLPPGTTYIAQQLLPYMMNRQRWDGLSQESVKNMVYFSGKDLSTSFGLYMLAKDYYSGQTMHALQAQGMIGIWWSILIMKISVIGSRKYGLVGGVGKAPAWGALTCPIRLLGKTKDHPPLQISSSWLIKKSTELNKISNKIANEILFAIHALLGFDKVTHLGSELEIINTQAGVRKSPVVSNASCMEL
ncbi:MAG: hypothetical protein M1814_006501 [Vezdaea aestivalis]|nr:MAG: hypothetical protein M1814_006501 [Vezdaea aestivalis]